MLDPVGRACWQQDQSTAAESFGLAGKQWEQWEDCHRRDNDLK